MIQSYRTMITMTQINAESPYKYPSIPIGLLHGVHSIIYFYMTTYTYISAVWGVTEITQVFS